MNSSEYEIPILILGFNRLDNIEKLVNSLRNIKPKYLYINLDGARHEQDLIVLGKIKKFLTDNIDWECNTYHKYNDVNLGCKNSVHDATQWFFSKVSAGIVLEDDCIPTPAFFHYVSDMLRLYGDDKRIATIGGRREVDFQVGSILHSSKFFCWGWASWSDRILGIDVEFGYQTDLPGGIFEGISFFEKQHVKGMHNMMLEGVVNSWAYSYDIYFRSKQQFHVIPPENYIKNVGIGTGTHNSLKKYDAICLGETWNQNSPPDSVKRSAGYMKQYFKMVYGIVKMLFFPYVGYLKSLKHKFRV